MKRINQALKELTLDLDVKPGEHYWIRISDKDWLFSFAGVSAKGYLKFEAQDDVPGMETPYHAIQPSLWRKMRHDGRARRVPKAVMDRKNGPNIGDIPPTYFLDPDEKGISANDRDERLRRLQLLAERRALRFFVIKADEDVLATRGHAGVNKFIERHTFAAAQAGHEWVPSAPTLLRAMDRFGLPLSRPLSAFFFDFGVHDKLKVWHPFVIEQAELASQDFWNSDPVRKPLYEVRETFYEAILKKIKDFEANGMAVPVTLKKPSDSAFRLWIYSKESWWTWKARFGEKAANARFLGIGRHIEASEILEFVLIDHTTLDVWAVVEDRDGNAIFVERPTLTVAIDLYSRMILAAVLSFEPPSIYNAMAVIEEIARAKEFLEEYGWLKGACDGWGKPRAVIVDNGWELAGESFQATMEGAGIDVIWAPVKTPEFKAVVERIFKTLNDLVWHRLLGGVPLTPQLRSRLGLEPEGDAIFSIRDLRERMWHAIVTVLHLEPHTTTGKAPARMWSESKARDGRRSVDDVTVFDSLLGQARNVWLSRKGVEIDGQVFHDQAITTELLLRLTAHALTHSPYDAKLLKSKRVGVLATTDRVDASYIMVWDPSTKRGVRLPNVRREFANGISWRLIKRIKEFAKRENLAFHSEDEMIYARAELSRRLREQGFFPNFREARKFASDIDPSPALVPGDRVTQVEVGSEDDIPAVTSAALRDDSRRRAKGFNRARPKKTSATGKTGKAERRSPLDRPKAKAQDSPVAANRETSRDGPGGRNAETGMSDSDADAMMRELMKEMNQ